MQKEKEERKEREKRKLEERMIKKKNERNRT